MPVLVGLGRPRARTISLLVLVVLCDGAAMWLSRSPHQAVVSGLTLAALVATVGALISLMSSKGDWPVRGPLLLVVVAHTAYKAYVLVDFLRHG